MFRNLKESIKDLLEDKNLTSAQEEGNIVNVWKEVVGASIFRNTKIKHFQKGVLTIKAQTPVWRNELLFQKTDIINKLNKKQIQIKEIRFL